MEKITARQFDVLVHLEEEQGKIFDKDRLVKRTNLTEKDAMEAVEVLIAAGYITKQEDSYKVTDDGYAFLEPHKVKRAILLAAGKGTRMQPVTLERPKPLVNVNGKVIITTLLDELLHKGIDDITIVTGYLSEKFDEIKEKYPMIRFLHNDKYNTQNNISSAMLVKDLYAGAYVMDADLYLMNPDMIRKYEYSSNYLGVYVEKTDDWRFVMNGENAVGMTTGGENAYLMVGISYWSPEDGKHFAEDIVKLYETEEGKQMYWDDVALTKYNEDFDIHVRACSAEDIVEIDSIAELAQIDPSYAKYVPKDN